MPPAKARAIGPLGWVILALLATGYAYAAWRKPLIVFIGTGLLVVWAVIARLRMKHRLRSLASGRAGESIGSFAQEFDRRTVDTWVVRAVYEEIQRHLASEYPSFPVRPSDRLTGDLLVDEDDLEDDLARTIAERAGRSLSQMTENPYYGRVNTVEDLVGFFCAQPRGAGEQRI